MEVVDTHFHLWKLDKFDYPWPTITGEKTIYKDFLPQDYDKERSQTPIGHAVFVEVHESIEETEWVLQLARQHPFIKGVVGYVDLTSERLEDDLIRLQRDVKFVGTRKVLDLSEEGWIEREDVIRGMDVLERRGLTYDLLLRTKEQWDSALRFLDRIPCGLKVVIDHMGKPDAKKGAPQWWYDGVEQAASHSNVHCKLSGMITEGDYDQWNKTLFMQHLDHVIKHFGIDRVMFGSDWPVCKLANGDLPDVYELFCELTSDLKDEDKRKVLRDNAVRFYNLKL